MAQIVSGLLFLVLALASVWVVTKPIRVISSFCCLHIINLFAPLLAVNLGGLNIYPLDALVSAMSIFALGRLVTRKIVTPPAALAIPALLLTFGLIVNFSRGLYLSSIPFTTIVNFARGYVYISGCLLYFCAVSVDSVSLYEAKRVWQICAATLLLVVAGRYAGILPHANIDDRSAVIVQRAVPAESALILSMVWVWTWVSYKREERTTLDLAILNLCPIAVLVLQHRSVWTASLAMLVAIIIFKHGKRLSAFAAAIVITVSLTLIFTLGQNLPVVQSILLSGERGLEAKDTAQWRLQNWDATLSPETVGSDLNYVIGREMGLTLSRYINGKWTTVVGAHNFYVSLVSDLGFIGLISFVGFVAALFVYIQRYKIKPDGIDILIVGSFAYWITYGIDFYTFMILIAVIPEIRKNYARQKLRWEKAQLVPPHLRLQKSS